MSSTTISIKGMTCGHCEGRVTAELKKIDGVTEVVASAESANAVITPNHSKIFDLLMMGRGYNKMLYSYINTNNWRANCLVQLFR